MKDMIIISDTPLSKNNLSDLLIKEFKNLSVAENTEQRLYIKRKSSGLEIFYTPADTLEKFKEEMGEETYSAIPNKDSYLTNISVTDSAVAKRVVAVIKNNFGEVWIDDDDYDWLGKASDFLKSKHQEKAESQTLSDNARKSREMDSNRK